MIDAKQIRAARALLRWSQEDLAERSGISLQTIKNTENERSMPHATSIDAIQSTFEMSGVEFLDRSGTRLKSEFITVLEGEGANKKLLDDIYSSLKDFGGGEVLIAGLEESAAMTDLEEQNLKAHIDRLWHAGIQERILLKQGDTNYVAPWSYYRWIPEEYFESTPIQIYANKIAMIKWDPPEKVIIVESAKFANSYRKLFNFVWDRAQVPPNPGEGSPSKTAKDKK